MFNKYFDINNYIVKSIFKEDRYLYYYNLKVGTLKSNRGYAFSYDFDTKKFMFSNGMESNDDRDVAKILENNIGGINDIDKINEQELIDNALNEARDKVNNIYEISLVYGKNV